MKPAKLIFPALAILFAAALLAGCSKTDRDDKPVADADKEKTAEKTEPAESKAGVTLDTETQERIGLKTETPAPTQWQPQFQAIGNVADPLAFATAATDFESARAAAAASQADFERTKVLAAQNNSSPKALETAHAAAARDSLAVASARAKFAGEWGELLAAQTNLTEVANRLRSGEISLIKLSLAVGAFPNPLPQHATIFLFGGETNSVEADFADDLHVAPATQTQTLLFSADKNLPPGISVTAQLRTSGEPVSGVTVPASAVLRHQGLGWVYVQTATNQFQRVEIQLERLTGTGWFVSENLSATNRIVVSGAQTVLSTELSAGGFTTGERD